MQQRQLKTLVEAGHYKLEPALVADAMLQRRGVRELLLVPGLVAASPAGRIPPPPAAGRRAA
jgi:hypothetical protein